MRILLAVLLAVVSMAAMGQIPNTESVRHPDRSWHVLCTTQDGAISLIKDLTKKEAEFIRDREMGEPATDKEKADAKAANAKQVAETEKIIRAKGKACPAKMKNGIPEDGVNYSVPVSDHQYVEACVMLDGHIAEFGGGGAVFGRIVSGGSIRSCEVFQ